MTDKKNAPIGVFDSGVGGLTVAREIMRNLPGERIVYFGDTARVPYGSKSKETVLRYSRQIVRFLQTQEVKTIVVACNTASSGRREKGRSHMADYTALIGTNATVKSDLYRTTIQEINPRIQVIGQACPLFVPLVEEGWWKDPVTVEVAKRYLDPLLEKGIDTLILGCTHYPLLRSLLREVAGEQVTLVNPAYETARALARLLKERDLEAEGEKEEEFPYRFFVSDEEAHFQQFANSILPYDVKMTKQINIEEY